MVLESEIRNGKGSRVLRMNMEVRNSLFKKCESQLVTKNSDPSKALVDFYLVWLQVLGLEGFWGLHLLRRGNRKAVYQAKCEAERN